MNSLLAAFSNFKGLRLKNPDVINQIHQVCEGAFQEVMNENGIQEKDMDAVLGIFPVAKKEIIKAAPNEKLAAILNAYLNEIEKIYRHIAVFFKNLEQVAQQQVAIENNPKFEALGGDDYLAILYNVFKVESIAEGKALLDAINQVSYFKTGTAFDHAISEIYIAVGTVMERPTEPDKIAKDDDGTNFQKAISDCLKLTLSEQSEKEKKEAKEILSSLENAKGDYIKNNRKTHTKDYEHLINAVKKIAEDDSAEKKERIYAAIQKAYLKEEKGVLFFLRGKNPSETFAAKIANKKNSYFYPRALKAIMDKTLNSIMNQTQDNVTLEEKRGMKNK